MESILIPLFRASIQLIEIFKWAIFARILISWIQPPPSGRWMEILHSTTEPFLKFFRELIPRMGMVDFSPIIAFLVLGFIQGGLASFISKLY